jgi:hypothetical protein
VARQRRGQLRQTRGAHRGDYARFGHVVLHHEDEEGTRMRFEVGGDLPEFATEWLGAELAQRVAEVEAGLARRHPGAERAGDPFSDFERPRRHRLGDLVGVGSLSAEIRPHHPVARRHAVVDVEEERSDPVVELARDPVPLGGEVPAGLIGGGVGVMGAGEDNLVETLGAE